MPGPSVLPRTHAPHARPPSMVVRCCSTEGLLDRSGVGAALRVGSKVGDIDIVGLLLIVGSPDGVATRWSFRETRVTRARRLRASTSGIQALLELLVSVITIAALVAEVEGFDLRATAVFAAVP
eukprot:scaffold301_cov243-Pinguiococcus_pyrenoidosus.AAC.72